MFAEEWREVQDFPGYVVSNYGEVFNEKTRRTLTQSPVAYDIPTVGLNLEGKVFRRSVPVLVAKAFIKEDREHFDTPIHLDGDRTNCRVDNLAWRPRWFAVNYHKQVERVLFPDWRADIRLVETGEVFARPKEASMKYGELETRIVLSVANDSPVFPHGHHYQYAELED